ncbi:hypothetical protein STEG23_001143 [Scotinomys teguina]
MLETRSTLDRRVLQTLDYCIYVTRIFSRGALTIGILRNFKYFHVIAAYEIERQGEEEEEKEQEEEEQQQKEEREVMQFCA